MLYFQHKSEKTTEIVSEIYTNKYPNPKKLLWKQYVYFYTDKTTEKSLDICMKT